ncbi:MAG: ERF family protein [Gemmatimonadota bacterium]|nr:ERF family protein [Gemmatimonadota bacterium]
MSDRTLTEKLIAARAAIPNIPRTAENPHFRSKYAPLDAILDAVVPALAAEGLSLIQPVAVTSNGPVVRTIISDGQEEVASEYPLPSKLVEQPQKFGAAVTYAKKYSLSALLALSTEEDDDGNAASGPERVWETVARTAAATAAPTAPGPESIPDGDEAAKKKCMGWAYRKLDEAFGEGKPWESSDKKAVFMAVFGTTYLKDIKARPLAELEEALRSRFLPAIEAQVAVAQTPIEYPADEGESDVF